MNDIINLKVVKGGEEMRYFNFCVDDETYKKAKIDAVNEGKTTKQYLVDILTEHLNQKMKKEEN